MQWRTIRHPDLPDHEAVTVPASAVPHHAAAGWEAADGGPPLNGGGEESPSAGGGGGSKSTGRGKAAKTEEA